MYEVCNLWLILTLNLNQTEVYPWNTVYHSSGTYWQRHITHAYHSYTETFSEPSSGKLHTIASADIIWRQICKGSRWTTAPYNTTSTAQYALVNFLQVVSMHWLRLGPGGASEDMNSPQHTTWFSEDSGAEKQGFGEAQGHGHTHTFCGLTPYSRVLSFRLHNVFLVKILCTVCRALISNEMTKERKE